MTPLQIIKYYELTGYIFPFFPLLDDGIFDVNVEIRMMNIIMDRKLALYQETLNSQVDYLDEKYRHRTIIEKIRMYEDKKMMIWLKINSMIRNAPKIK